MIRWLLDVYASSQGPWRLILRALWEIIRRTLMFFGDPSYETVIRDKKIRLPISHKLPLYIANHRYYDELPVRLSTYLRKKHGCLTMIDVGANVGDTILSCYDAQQDKFLAIESNPNFVKYLKQNCAHVQNIKLVEAFCFAEDHDQIPVKIEAANGTARVIKSQDGIMIPQKKLDTIITAFPQFLPCNFLKIDTDGSDFDVIRGAQKTIIESKPIVLMECDVFDNKNYIADFSEIMDFLLRSGYENIIAYDNLGYLFQVFPLKDYLKFKYALFHQLISDFGYFDLLILDNTCQDFIDMELAYFTNTVPNQNRKHIAGKALDL